jgi:two-component system, NtrC family, sensor kinase
LPEVPALVGEINQMLLNLIVNAAQAMRSQVEDTGEKGLIRVSTRMDGGWYEIRVADNGPGIPVDIQEDVFTPFFTTKDVGDGTGQGLAIARTVVVDKHQGKLELESIPGDGATFIIRLPVRAGANEPPPT